MRLDDHFAIETRLKSRTKEGFKDITFLSYSFQVIVNIRLITINRLIPGGNKKVTHT